MVMYNYKERGPPIFSLKTLVLLFFIVNITNSQSSEVSYVTHEENISGLKIVQADSYITNGAICFRLAKKSLYFEECNDEIVYLRLLKLDGSVETLDFAGIPQESFCKGNPVGVSFHKKHHKNHDYCKYGDHDSKCGSPGKMPNEPGGGGGGGTPNTPGGGGGGTPNTPGGGGG
ncbi:10894_t:CDS:2, partial [Funneliformis geosporum]